MSSVIVKGPLSLISPTIFSGRPFHILTATCEKLLPVDWVLDFGSSRAWLGIDRLERVILLIWNGGGSNLLRSAGQWLVYILYRTGADSLDLNRGFFK